MSAPVVTIPRKLSKGEELVVIRKRDFDAFQKWQAEVQDVLDRVQRGRKEYKKKQTMVAESPKAFR